jgi:hypothetical protein
VVLSSGWLGQIDQPTTNIAGIYLRNNREKAHDVTVVIERSDREVFRETPNSVPAVSDQHAG